VVPRAHAGHDPLALPPPDQRAGLPGDRGLTRHSGAPAKAGRRRGLAPESRPHDSNSGIAGLDETSPPSFSASGGCAAALPAASRVAWSQAYPSRPCVLSLASPAAARPISSHASWRNGCRSGSGSNSLWDNRPALPATSARGRCESAPGRLHALIVVATNTVNATLYENLSFDFIRDLAPVASIASTATSWWSTRVFPPRPFLSSLRMPRPTRTSSTWRRAASGLRVT